MVQAHRRTAETRDVHRYASVERGRFGPSCDHGTTMWEGEMPHCGERQCLWRWWRRYGIPVAILLVGFVAYCSTVLAVPSCAPGWDPVGLGDCIRR